MDGLPLAIELAAARVNVLGLAELALARRAPPGAAARPAGAGRRRAPRSRRSSSGATTSCTPTRRRCSTSSPCTEAARRSPSLVAVGDRHGLDEATVTYLLGSAGRQVDRPGLVPERRGALRPARHRPRLRARAPCRKRRPRRCPRRARRVLRHVGRAARPRAARDPSGRPGRSASNSRTTTSGPRSTYAREAPDPALAIRLGASWAGTSRSRERSPRDAASSSSHARSRLTTRPRSCGWSCSRPSASWPPRSSILTPRSRLAIVPLRSRRPLRRPR